MKKLKVFVCVIIFGILFTCGFSIVANLVRYKGMRSDTMGAFYDLEKDSVDVLILGSSEAYSAFSPMQMWEENGIKSFNMASPSQPFPMSYYLMKEGIRTQHPKIMVVEVYETFEMQDYWSAERVHESMDRIPLNGTKFEIIKDYLSRSMSKRELIEYAFPIITYHSRIYDLEPHDLVNTNSYLKGFALRARWAKQTKPDLTEETADVYDLNMEYLEKMVQLCENEGIQLVLCKTPMAQYERGQEDMKKFNTIKTYAQNKGIEYVDYNELRDEIGIDFEYDYLDAIHVNINGAEKITEYLGKYLQQTLGTMDSVDEENDDKWNKDLKRYHKEEKRTKRKLQRRIDKYEKASA